MAGMTLRQAALDRAEDVGGAAQRDRAEQAFARLDRWFNRFLLLRTTVAATLTVAAAAAALPAIGIATVEDPRQFWFGAAAPVLLGWAGALLAVAFGCVTAWPVARTIAGWGWLPQCLRNAELEPFHHICSLAAAGTVDVIDHAGHAIPADAFRSPWSLALFSAEARHRQLLRSRAADEMDGQLLLREPPAPPVAGPDLPELRQRLDQLGEQIAHLPARPDQEASHTMLAQRIDALDNRIAALATPVQTTVQRKRRQPRRHWMADVDAHTFTSRLPLALAAWEGPAAERVKCALQTSFEVTREDRQPCIAVCDLRTAITAALVSRKLGIGLGGQGKSGSPEWIGKMFGFGDAHDLSRIRRLFTQRDLPLDRRSAKRRAAAKTRKTTPPSQPHR
jgi:hypothetical protein